MGHGKDKDREVRVQMVVQMPETTIFQTRATAVAAHL
ncbi:hypothetical protein CGMCC3_g14744 [Colletotrichum fructicola]|nr:uncharacterized protein CGMCC3_g14744 [Colletotrichum fructicola]KAE9569212.1 hypothetical protein CGMCC3_g14744 [Colletotrichum fructicola]